MGKSFPLFRVRHTPKQVPACQWEKRSICTFEEVASHRVTHNRRYRSSVAARARVVTCCVYVTYGDGPDNDILAPNMQY